MSSASLAALLRLLVAHRPSPRGPTLEAYWAACREVRDELPEPMLRATAGGFFADRVGFAFAAGYQAALSALFGVGPHQLASLSATEAGGARPRDLRTSLLPDGAGFRLSGEKVFTTASVPESLLFVVATTGPGPDGRPRLKVARVPASAPGVTLEPLTSLPFVPEVPHATVKLQNVAVASADVLEGDGYARYLKPFRTVEDLHVHAGVLGYLMSLARRFDWPRPVQEALLALVTCGVALAALPADAPETHVALAGFLAEARALLERCAPHLEQVEPEERARWNRDRPLFQVAERVRAQRLERAWERLRASNGL